MGGVYQGLGWGAKSRMIILLGARGVSPQNQGPHAWKRFNIFEYPGFATNHSVVRVYILSSFV